jgi:H+/Cl- antiporter ClcA
VAYGYSFGAIVSGVSFLEGVSQATPQRRVLVLTICGLLAASGSWAIHRFGRPLVSVAQATGPELPLMPALPTLANAALQIVTVAMGSPLGREVAPREVAAAFTERLCARARLSRDDSRMMIACGAGAGLAAVYNVPLGGTLFVLEVLLGTFAHRAVIAAVMTSVIASLVAWIALGDEWLYVVPHFPISPSLLCWALATGPIFGWAAYGYARVATLSRQQAPRDWHLLPWCLIVFFAIGLLSIPFPQLPGNGKGPTLLGFEGKLSGGLAATLLALKVLAIFASLRAGAQGGTLTPSLTIGALLAVLLGLLWNLGAPHVPLGAFAIVGAAAFLAAAMRMPLTATVLVIEFTQADHDFWIPILLAVAGSVAAFHLHARHHAAGRHVRE